MSKITKRKKEKGIDKKNLLLGIMECDLFIGLPRLLDREEDWASFELFYEAIGRGHCELVGVFPTDTVNYHIYGVRRGISVAQDLIELLDLKIVKHVYHVKPRIKFVPILDLSWKE